jgi:DNA-binding transcriptional LysR family regulator
MRYPDVDISLLRCFVCVAEQGSFTAASHILHLTQSAVSLQIKRLEQLIGKRVFHRTSRSIVLTSDGELLLTYARRMLALNDELIQRVMISPMRGHLRLGVAQHFLPQHIPVILAEFLAQFPDVQLEVEVGETKDLRASYERGQLELVIAEPHEAGDIGVGGQPIMSEGVAWVMALPSTMSERATPGDQVMRVVLQTPGNPLREAAIAALQQAKIPYRIIYTSPSLLAHRRGGGRPRGHRRWSLGVIRGSYRAERSASTGYSRDVRLRRHRGRQAAHRDIGGVHSQQTARHCDQPAN